MILCVDPRAEGEMNDTDARFWRPWLRINRVLRVMLHTRWSAESGQGRRSSDDATLAGVTLFDALHAFFQEHRYCGDLDGGVDGDRVWMTCTCGAVINRRAVR
jgi:hypothetical protein